MEDFSMVTCEHETIPGLGLHEKKENGEIRKWGFNL